MTEETIKRESAIILDRLRCLRREGEKLRELVACRAYVEKAVKTLDRHDANSAPATVARNLLEKVNDAIRDIQADLTRTGKRDAAENGGGNEESGNHTEA